MTRKTETLEKIEAQVGSLYEGLKYAEDNKFARFFPVWFILKRYVFLFMVFNIEYTHGMIVFCILLTLVEVTAFN
jgi:hypothetical protein